MGDAEEKKVEEKAGPSDETTDSPAMPPVAKPGLSLMGTYCPLMHE
jgi:hypothetical protein